jgi:hypothetical protein
MNELDTYLDDDLPGTRSSSIVGKLRVFKDVLDRERMGWDGEMGKQVSSFVETQRISMLPRYTKGLILHVVTL